MYKALIIHEDHVKIVDVADWNCEGRDYIKVKTPSGSLIICSSTNIRLFNKPETMTDEEMVKKVTKTSMPIKYYEEEFAKKLKK